MQGSIGKTNHSLIRVALVVIRITAYRPIRRQSGRWRACHVRPPISTQTGHPLQRDPARIHRDQDDSPMQSNPAFRAVVDQQMNDPVLLRRMGEPEEIANTRCSLPATSPPTSPRYRHRRRRRMVLRHGVPPKRKAQPHARNDESQELAHDFHHALQWDPVCLPTQLTHLAHHLAARRWRRVKTSCKQRCALPAPWVKTSPTCR